MALVDNDTAATKVASGTEAERPGSPSAGMVRFNSTSSKYEVYDGTAWVALN